MRNIEPPRTLSVFIAVLHGNKIIQRFCSPFVSPFDSAVVSVDCNVPAKSNITNNSPIKRIISVHVVLVPDPSLYERRILILGVLHLLLCLLCSN